MCQKSRQNIYFKPQRNIFQGSSEESQHCCRCLQDTWCVLSYSVSSVYLGMNGIFGEGTGTPLQYSCLVGCSPRGH